MTRPRLFARVLVAGWVGAAVVAGAAWAKPSPSPVEVHTRHLLDLAKKAAKTKDPAERRELLEEIEWTKHQLGPVDARGRRISCKAMWHDAALRDLERDLARLKTAANGGDPVARVRLALRQMAAVGLARGWAEPEGATKFRFDAVGTYLANNLPALEDLLGRAVKHLQRAGRPPFEAPDEGQPAAAGSKGAGASGTPGPAAPAAEGAGSTASGGGASGEAGGGAGAGSAAGPKDPAAAPEGSTPADPRTRALDLLQESLARLVQAAADAHGADFGTKGGRTVQKGALTDFGEALGRVYRMTLALDRAGATGRVVLPPEEAYGLTPEDGAAVAEARKRVEAIKAPEWSDVRESLLEYLATAEQGLKHPRARRKARRLLGVVDRTAGFVLGLLSSKSLPPEELPEAHEAVVEALGEVGRPDSREYGYRRLLRMAGGGSFRRHLDASPLPAETCRALARLRRLESSAFGGKDAETRRERFMRHLDRLVVGLSKVKSAPPPEMDRSLASLYVQTGAVLRRSAEVLAALPTDAPDALAALAARAAEAATLAKDLDRIERADRILGGARRLLGESSRPLARAVVARLEGFAMDPSPGKADAREAFDEYLQEVRALEWLRLPDRPHLALAMRLSGGAYRLAAQRFGEELRRGMAAVAQGSPVRLGWALTASPLFTLLRHRAVVETTGLGRLNPAALEPFSLPPKTWKVFLAALDKKVADGLRQCAQVRGWSSSLGASVKRWSRVFQTVAAAMARTRKAAEAGRDDLARVVGAIEQAADPQTPGDVWGEWATGFHTLEAAVALVAGYPTVASFHYDALYEVRDYHRLKDRLTVSTFDP